VVITNLDDARSTLLFNPKIEEVIDDERIEAMWLRTERNPGF
jgi:hypothetical protein